ncbi:MAG: ABC transporter substrate-binding protein [Candidatus Hodarchaeota archaeon]
MSDQKLRRLALVILIFLLSSLIFPISFESSYIVPQEKQGGSDVWDPTAPYVDRAIFHVIEGQERQIAALVAGEIDHLTDYIEQTYLDELEANPDIEVTYTQSFRYYYMFINCARYPYSIPAFRRALAYAVDKEEIAQSWWEDRGFGIDNPILQACGIWHNNDTHPISFLVSDVIAARAELTAAGFFDLDGDGFVEAPNGSSFVFQPMYPIEVPQWSEVMASMKSYWDQAGILTNPEPRTFSTMIDTVYTIPRNYDGACFWSSIEPNPLALQQWTTDQILNPEGNEMNWSNSTFDYWVDIMMTSSDYDFVLDAAHRAQRIFVEEVPMLVLCSYWEANAHRNDRFEGWVVSPGYGITLKNYWTPRTVRLLPSQPERDPTIGTGGTFHSMIASSMDSQNPLTSISPYGQYPLSQIYVSLKGLSHPLDHTPTFYGGGLAYHWEIYDEAEGLRLDFTLYGADFEHRQAYWQSGEYGGHVTAHDVKFTYDYIINHSIPKFARQIPYVNRTEVLDEYQVRIVTNSKSYWVFDAIADWPILPRYMWSGIVSPITFTNPQPVGCGPFKWYQRVEGEYTELEFWERYHEAPPSHQNGEFFPDHLRPLLFVGFMIISITLIACIIYLYAPTFKKRPKDEPHPLDTKTLLAPKSYPHPCPRCNTELSGDERFCPKCGHPQ